jgi:amicoumacin kinase
VLIDDSLDRPQRTRPPYAGEVPRQCAERWGSRISVERCVGSWENYVYEVIVDGHPAILRLTDDRHRRVGQVTAELEWINFLYDSGLPVLRPILSLEHLPVETIQDGGCSFAACLFPKCEGTQPSPARCRELGYKFLFDLGVLIGCLHSSAVIYGADGMRRVDRPNVAQDDLIVNVGMYLRQASSSFARELAAIAQWLTEQPEDSTFGLIHGDIHGRNLLMQDANFTLIDFDDCCYGWFAYDLGVALNWAFPPDHPKREQALDWLLSGYSTVREVNAFFREQIIVFIRVRLIQDYILAMSRLTDPTYPHRWLRSRAATLARRLGISTHRASGGELRERAVCD